MAFTLKITVLLLCVGLCAVLCLGAPRKDGPKGATKRQGGGGAGSGPGAFVEDENITKPISLAEYKAWELHHVGNELEGGFILMSPDDKGAHVVPVDGVEPSAVRGPEGRQSYTLINKDPFQNNQVCPKGYNKEWIPDDGVYYRGWMHDSYYCVCPQGWFDLHKGGKPFSCTRDRPGQFKSSGFGNGRQASVTFKLTATKTSTERLNEDCKRLQNPGQADAITVHDPWKNKICIGLFNAYDCSLNSPYVLVVKDANLDEHGFNWWDKTNSVRVIAWNRCPSVIGGWGTPAGNSWVGGASYRFYS